jgi:hypothetical protein
MPECSYNLSLLLIPAVVVYQIYIRHAYIFITILILVNRHFSFPNTQSIFLKIIYNRDEGQLLLGWS